MGNDWAGESEMMRMGSSNKSRTDFLLCRLCGGEEALVLVTPNDEVEKVGEERVGDVVLGTVGEAVLVEDKQVEPLVACLHGSHEANFLVSKGAVQTLIPDRSETVESKLGAALCE